MHLLFWQLDGTFFIHLNVENVENYTLVGLALHNYVRLTEDGVYRPSGFVDCVDDTGRIKEGD